MKYQTTENVQRIPIKEIQPFHNHPFTVADNEDMAKIVESIDKVGTITPLLARPLPDGGYELISGHRRLEACRKLGLENIPVIVREMTDDEAVIAKPRLHCAHRSRKAVCQSQRNQPGGKPSDRERRLAALYDPRLSPLCGEYS